MLKIVKMFIVGLGIMCCGLSAFADRYLTVFNGTSDNSILSMTFCQATSTPVKFGNSQTGKIDVDKAGCPNGKLFLATVYAIYNGKTVGACQFEMHSLQNFSGYVNGNHGSYYQCIPSNKKKK